jgi:hypothetical protein
MLYKLNPLNLFVKKFGLNQDLVKKVLRENYDSYIKIKDLFKDKLIKKEKVTFYYPGCGWNILHLLLIYDALVSRKNKEAHFVLVDMRDTHSAISNEIAMHLKGARIVEKVVKGKYIAKIYFKDRVFKITAYIKSALSFTPPEIKSKIDVYYERAFELFRTNDDFFLPRICSLTKKGGLMITDHSFRFGKFKDRFKKLEEMPKGLGLYPNFQVWQKIIE